MRCSTDMLIIMTRFFVVAVVLLPLVVLFRFLSLVVMFYFNPFPPDHLGHRLVREAIKLLKLK